MEIEFAKVDGSGESDAVMLISIDNLLTILIEMNK